MEINKQNELTGKIETDQQADSYRRKADSYIGRIEQKRGKTLRHRKKDLFIFLT